MAATKSGTTNPPQVYPMTSHFTRIPPKKTGSRIPPRSRVLLSMSQLDPKNLPKMVIETGVPWGQIGTLKQNAEIQKQKSKESSKHPCTGATSTSVLGKGSCKKLVNPIKPQDDPLGCWLKTPYSSSITNSLDPQPAVLHHASPHGPARQKS